MKRLLLCLILLSALLMPLYFDYSAPNQASASIIDKIELTDQRTRTSKTYRLGETPDGLQRFALDASLWSIHYLEAGQWLEIDSTLVESNKPGWDWEVEKGSYKILIKDDTSVAVGRDGYWLGFRYEGLAYLDKSTNEYEILASRQTVSPTIDGNKIRWENIMPGVNLEYIYGNDRFKENLEITQAARNWCASHPPSSYGMNNQTTYLVGYIQCDWRYAGRAELDGETISWSTDVETYDTPINFWHPIKNQILAALPVDYAYSQTDLDFEPLKLNKRFIRAPDDNHYLLFGGKVTDLHQFPSGTIVFDPTIDEQVGASSDDCLEHSTGVVTALNDQNMQHYDEGDVGGYRFTGINIPNGATINAGTNLTHWVPNVDYDDPNVKIHCENGSNPGTFVQENNHLTNRTWTTSFVLWEADGIGAGWQTGPDVDTEIQEVVDDNSGTGDALVFFTDSQGTGAGHRFNVKTYDYDDNSWGAKLHIEYTTGGGPSAPTVITNAATSVEETSATLSGNITATGGENCTDRGFYWDTDSGNPYADTWLEQGNYGISQFTHGIPGLTEGELYYFIATANNTGGTGNGTELTFLTKPDEPTSLIAASQNSTRLTMTWTNGNGYDRTLLRYNGTGYPPVMTTGNLSANTTDTTANITSLAPGTQYWAWVYSWAAEGGLEQNSDATANATDYTLPGDPSGMVSENATATSIDVRWTKGTGGDYTMVRRKTGSYPTGVGDGTQAYYDTGSDFSDAGLDKGTAYYYRGWARDSASAYYSASYTSASATTNTTAPTVTNASGATSITDTSAQLNGLITDTGGNTTTAYIYWGATDGSDNLTAWDNWENRGEQAGAFSYTTSNLTASTMYFYRCYATNDEGTDWADTTANLTTLAEGEALSPPTNLTAVYVNENEVTLAWTPGDYAEYTMIRANYSAAPENIEQGYCVYYGAGSNATDYMVDLNLRDATVHYSAWSENTTMSWSADYATASVENLGMSDFVDAFLPIVVVGIMLVLAHWRRIRPLYIIAGFACILYGFIYWAGSVYISLLIIMLGIVSFLEAWLDKGEKVRK